MRPNTVETVLKQRAYFLTVIDGAFCVGRACYKQMRDAFQLSRLTGVRLWVVITLHDIRTIAE